MFHSVTCRLKETVDSPTPSVEKSKRDPVIQGNLKIWFIKTFSKPAERALSPSETVP